MTEMNSRPIIQRTVVRQSNEPNRQLSGMTWINPAGGQSGNNSETYIWNDDTDVWELTRSTGPDTPLHPAAGATWTDTANGTVKNYRSGAWQNVGVTDHANLSNVTANQHHSAPQYLTYGATWSDGDVTTGPNFVGTSTLSKEWFTVASAVGWNYGGCDGVRVYVHVNSGPRGATHFRFTQTDGTVMESLDWSAGNRGSMPPDGWVLCPVAPDSIDKIEIRLNNGDPVTDLDVREVQVFQS